MADIALVDLSISGATPVAAAASAGGDAVPNTRGTSFVRVINGGGGSINVTAAAQLTSRGADSQFPAQTVANVVVAVPAGAARVIGPFPSAYNDGNAKVQLTYSGVTSVTVEGWKLP